MKIFVNKDIKHFFFFLAIMVVLVNFLCPDGSIDLGAV